MAGNEISLPEQYSFSTQIPIRLGDINRGNHLSHVALISIIEESRARFLANRGYGDLNTNSRTMGYLITDIAVSYKKQAYYGQTLQIEIAATGFRSRSFEFVYHITDAADGTEIARAMTGQILFAYQEQKVMTVPEEFKTKLSSQDGPT